MSRLLLALTFLLAVPASAPAAAGAPANVLLSGPVLVDDGVVWSEREGRRYAVLGARADGTVRRLHEGVAHRVTSDGSVAAALITASDFRMQLWTGNVGDGLRRAYTPPEECSTQDAEVDGGLMAVEINCGEEDSRVVVRRAGVAERSFAAVGSGGLEVAGRYVAYRAKGGTGGTVVYDALADRVVLRVPRVEGASTYPVALQPDGKLVVGLDDGTAGDTAWLSPARPTLRAVGVEPRTVRGFARDRVLTLREEPSRRAFRSVGSRLELLGLDGSRRLVASAPGLGLLTGAHYDGSRVALAHATCNGSRILVRSAVAPAFSPGAPRPCRLLLAAPVTFGFNVNDRPRVDVEVRCAQETLRVCDEIVLRAPDGRKLSRASYGHMTHDTGNYGVHLTADGIRHIAREGSTQVRIEMQPRDSAPFTQLPRTATLRVEPKDLARLRSCVRTRRNPSVCPD